MKDKFLIMKINLCLFIIFISVWTIRIRISKSLIAKCVYTHKEFVLVSGASSTESTDIVQTTYNLR